MSYRKLCEPIIIDYYECMHLFWQDIENQLIENRFFDLSSIYKQVRDRRKDQLVREIKLDLTDLELDRVIDKLPEIDKIDKKLKELGSDIVVHPENTCDHILLTIDSFSREAVPPILYTNKHGRLVNIPGESMGPKVYCERFIKYTDLDPTECSPLYDAVFDNAKAEMFNRHGFNLSFTWLPNPSDNELLQPIFDEILI